MYSQVRQLARKGDAFAGLSETQGYAQFIHDKFGASVRCSMPDVCQRTRQTGGKCYHTILSLVYIFASYFVHV